MSIQATARQLAQAFHENYDRLAPEFDSGYKRVSWENLPHDGKRLMCLAAEAVMDQLKTEPVIVELYGAGDQFPVEAASGLLFVECGTPERKPGNPGEMSFNFTEIDQPRINQLIGIMRGMGFVPQRLAVEYKVQDWTMVHLMFGQTSDPRPLPEATNVSD